MSDTSYKDRCRLVFGTTSLFPFTSASWDLPLADTRAACMQNQGAASVLGLMSLGMVIISDGINKTV